MVEPNCIHFVVIHKHVIVVVMTVVNAVVYYQMNQIRCIKQENIK